MKNIENNLISLIDRKLSNELTKDEMANFNNLIDKDIHFENEVKLHSEIDKAIARYLYMDTMSKFMFYK